MEFMKRKMKRARRVLHLFDWRYWLQYFLYMMNMCRKFNDEISFMEWINGLSEDDMRILRKFRDDLILFVDTISALRGDPPSHHLPVEGMVSIRAMQASRKAKKAARKESARMMMELGLTSWSSDYYFDFCGIKWMMEGRWGENHPCEDSTNSLWNCEGLIHSFYKDI